MVGWFGEAGLVGRFGWLYYIGYMVRDSTHTHTWITRKIKHGQNEQKCVQRGGVGDVTAAGAPVEMSRPGPRSTAAVTTRAGNRLWALTKHRTNEFAHYDAADATYAPVRCATTCTNVVAHRQQFSAAAYINNRILNNASIISNCELVAVLNFAAYAWRLRNEPRMVGARVGLVGGVERCHRGAVCACVCYMLF